MAKAIEVKVYGIKCDAPGCGYRDETVPLGDYEAWIDRPCPKCGSNLLTRGDFETTVRLMHLADLWNDVAGEVAATPEQMAARHRIAVEMNGTGEVAFRFKPGAR